jgi:M6 family metalloprotease-like protein
MPLNPEVVERYTRVGKKVPISMTEARFAGEPGMTTNRVKHKPLSPAGQTLKAIVILVKFPDDPPGGPTTRFRPTIWDSLLFGDTYIRGGLDTTSTKTLRNFYREVSYGTVDIVTLDLPSSVGWVTAPDNYTYYCEPDGIHDNGWGPYPRNAQRLAMDAVLAADPYVDFSQYAVDGVVQNLFIVHAGGGAEWSGGPTLIWSHAWCIPEPLYVDGVLIDCYSMEPEAEGDLLGEAHPPMAPMLPTVGVYAHEFGHILGLPDEYDYGYESRGTGRVSLMAGGSWNRVPDIYPDCASNSPAHPSAWGTAYMGFVTPITVTTTTTGVTIPPIENTPTGAMYKVVYPGTAGKEYWLLENRQQIGFDLGFAGMMTADAHGLCIYHVDENVLDRTYLYGVNDAECVSGGVYQGQTNCNCATLPPNPSNGENWYGISLEQADGLYQLELGTSGGSWQDFYSSVTGKTTFNGISTPNSSSYYSHYSCAGLVAATNISEIGQNITLNLTPDASVPSVTVIRPNGGEIFYAGSQETIRWVATDEYGPDTVDIYYSIDGGSTYPYTIAGLQPNDGEFIWTIPGRLSSACKVVVFAWDGTGNQGMDMSDNNFTIAPPPDVTPPQVMVVKPNGGELFYAGSQDTIRWVATDNFVVDSVNIYYSTDGGGTFPYTIATGEENDSVYVWTVSNTPSNSCFIKIVVYDSSLNSSEDVSDGVFAISVPFTSLNCSAAVSCTTYGAALGVVVSGTYAYVAAWEAGLSVIDISTPSSPVFLDSCQTPGDAHGVAISGSYAFVPDYLGGFSVIDISNPANLSLAKNVDREDDQAYAVAISGNYAYLADGNLGLSVFDITVPTNPIFLTSCHTGRSARGVAISASYAFVADTDSGLVVINISDPSHPSKVRACNTPGSAEWVALYGGYAYVADYDHGMAVIDISNPTDPWIVTSVETSGLAFGLYLTRGHAFVADHSSGLHVFDVSDPSQPVEVDSCDTPGLGIGVVVSEDYAYVADERQGLYIIPIQDMPIAVEAVVGPPDLSVLGQNVPNPFNPLTRIKFSVANPGRVELRVYDIAGRLMRTLVDRTLEARAYEMLWDGRDDLGSVLTSGVYFYRLEIVGGYSETKKMVLLR